MKLSLNDLNDGHVYLGDKLNIRTIFNFDEDSSILWSGIEFLKKANIFVKGHF
ncbi:MAG: hypothetical protein ACTSQU_07500 [Promethearchaeota archaeon]